MMRVQWAIADQKPLRERNSFIQAALVSQFFAYLCGVSVFGYLYTGTDTDNQ
jgi:hypothetical protein